MNALFLGARTGTPKTGFRRRVLRRWVSRAPYDPKKGCYRDRFWWMWWIWNPLGLPLATRPLASQPWATQPWQLSRLQEMLVSHSIVSLENRVVRGVAYFKRRQGHGIFLGLLGACFVDGTCPSHSGEPHYLNWSIFHCSINCSGRLSL